MFGVSALAALAFAWHQIRQVDRSNRELIASNAASRRLNMEGMRPRVQVSLQPRRFVTRNRGADAIATIYIEVRNIGPSPAHNVRMLVDPPFTSSEDFFDQGKRDAHFEMVNKAFNGEISFPTLHPGNTYIWYLGRAPEVFHQAQEIPRRWTIHAQYDGTMSDEGFQDSFTLDLDVETPVDISENPLIRIGKDLEVVGDRLRDINRSVPRKLTLDEESISRLYSAAARRRSRPSIRRSRRLGRGRG